MTSFFRHCEELCDAAAHDIVDDEEGSDISLVQQ